MSGWAHNYNRLAVLAMLQVQEMSMANAYTLRVKEAQMNERMRELEAKLGMSSYY